MHAANDGRADVLWFLPTHGDGHYLGTSTGGRDVNFAYLRQIAQAADQLGYFGVLLPTGMVSVLRGTVDDGWNGVLGWIWLTCAVSTLVLVIVTQLALRERYYSAVMAATGLLYLAILTAFGTDLIARAVLA